MIHYSCDKCRQPITGPGGVATVTIETRASETLRMQLCRDCARGLLPEGSPRYEAVRAVTSWMDTPDGEES